MKTLITLYDYSGQELEAHRKIHDTRPYIEEIKGYVKAVEGITQSKVAYFKIEVIYPNN